MAEHIVRSRFNRGPRIQTIPTGESRTVQADKERCDINNIIAHHSATKMWLHVTTRKPLTGDFTAANDYAAHLENVLAVQDEFRGLEAHIRRAANNDAETFLRMLETEEGVEALRGAGLEFRDEEVPRPGTEEPPGEQPPPEVVPEPAEEPQA